MAKTKKTNNPEGVDLLKPALQGLAHWMSYRRILYPHYDPVEGALVVELCGLLSRRLPKGWGIAPEQPYKDMKVVSSSEKKAAGRKQSVDIAIGPLRDKQSDSTERRLVDPCIVLEIKRLYQSKSKKKASYLKDIDRLARVLERNNDAQAFVVVTSYGTRPEGYVNARGHAIHREYPKATSRGTKYALIRVFKSLESQAKTRRGSWVLLLEILRK